MEIYNPLNIQEKYKIGEPYLFAFRVSNSIVEDIGTVAEYGMTEDNIAYIKAHFDGATRKFVTNAGRPAYSKVYFTNSSQTLDPNSQDVNVPA